MFFLCFKRKRLNAYELIISLEHTHIPTCQSIHARMAWAAANAGTHQSEILQTCHLWSASRCNPPPCTDDIVYDIVLMIFSGILSRLQLGHAKSPETELCSRFCLWEWQVVSTAEMLCTNIEKQPWEFYHFGRGCDQGLQKGVSKLNSTATSPPSMGEDQGQSGSNA